MKADDKKRSKQRLDTLLASYIILFLLLAFMTCYAVKQRLDDYMFLLLQFVHNMFRYVIIINSKRQTINDVFCFINYLITSGINCTEFFMRKPSFSNSYLNYIFLSIFFNSIMRYLYYKNYFTFKFTLSIFFYYFISILSLVYHCEVIKLIYHE